MLVLHAAIEWPHSLDVNEMIFGILLIAVPPPDLEHCHVNGWYYFVCIFLLAHFTFGVCYFLPVTPSFCHLCNFFPVMSIKNNAFL